LPGISGTDARKVEAANNLYKAMAQLTEFLAEKGGCLDNGESRKLMAVHGSCHAWHSQSPMQFFIIYMPVPTVVLDGSRMKDISFFASRDEFAVSKFCDGTNSHDGWGFDH
jgi:hypothetical protein